MVLRRDRLVVVVDLPADATVASFLAAKRGLKGEVEAMGPKPSELS
jgi:hypothetical protein